MKSNRHLSLFILLFLTVIWNGRTTAQISEGGTPPSFNFPETETLKSDKSSFLVQPGFDIKAQIEADRQEQETSWGAAPLRIGKRIFVNETQGGIDLVRDGKKTVLPDGTEIWRLSVKSPNALAIGLYYDKFFIPKGGKLFIYNPLNRALIGAFTEKNNVAKGKKFATEMVLGDEMVLEYVSPVKTNGGSAIRKADIPQINISSISYGYNHIYGTQDEEDIGASSNCMVNINCSPEGDDWQDEKRGVAKIVYAVDIFYISMCSGSIVNNTAQDLTPYYLTAFHCIDGDVEYDTMTFYFHFENPACENTNTPPTTTKTMVGAEYIASSSIYGGNGSDGALLKLTDEIPSDYEVYYNGWDRTNPTTPFDGVSIHHPQGDLKKISTFVGATSLSQPINWQGGGLTPADAHWSVPFVATTNGTGGAQGGSSGSPLFNSEGLIVGTLSGGSQACAPSSSYYGKLWRHWDQGASEPLASYLDPIETGQTTLTGTYVTADTGAAFGMSDKEIYVFHTVKYTDFSNGAVTWHWEFEGGKPAAFEGKTPPEITYDDPGDFATTLTINKGTDDESAATRQISVIEKGENPVAPEANFALAKTVLFAEDFGVPGSELPQGWTTEKRGDSDETWSVQEDKSPDPVSPGSAAFQRWDDDNEVDSWLISPVIDIPAGIVPTLTFYCIGGGPWQENAWTYLYVIDEDGNEEEHWNNGYMATSTNHIWDQAVIDLSDYAGQSIKLAWRYYGQEGDAGWIDGIVVTTPPDTNTTLTINVGDYITPIDCSVGPPILYEWTFDGGEPAVSNKETPDPIRYMTPGKYDVTLWVKNYHGEDTRTLTDAITVVEQVPVAAYETEGGYTRRKNFGLFVPEGAEVNFIDKSEKYPTSWEWRFGGGGEPDTSTEQNPTVTFNTEGDFDFYFKAENSAYADSIKMENGIKVGGRDTIWNFMPGETPDGLYTSLYGYITGTNQNDNTAYAELFDHPLAKAAVTAVKVNLLVEDVKTAHRLPVSIAKMGADGTPGIELTRTIFKPINTNPNGETLIEFEVPAIVDGPFFVVLGDATGDDGGFYDPGYTAAIASTLERGAGAKSTFYLFDAWFYNTFGGNWWFRSDEYYSDLCLSLDVEPIVTYDLQYDGIDVDEKLNFRDVDKTKVEVNVKTNLPWSATSDASWVIITNGRQEGDGAFTISVSNNNYGPRRAIVKVSAGIGFEDYIIVQQWGTAPDDLTATVVNDETGEITLTWAAPIILEPASLKTDTPESHQVRTPSPFNEPKASAGEKLVLTNEKTGKTTEVTRNMKTTAAKAPANFTQANLRKRSVRPEEAIQNAATEEYPTVKLRYDDGAEYTAIRLNTPEDRTLEAAIRFTPEDLVNYHGSKMKAIDLFVWAAPSDGITINIRQGDDIIHSQRAGVASDKWSRIKFTNELPIDASKDLYVGYAAVQRDTMYILGAGAGPGTHGKSDLLAVDGEPFESLYELNSSLDFNWNIALLVEDKGTDYGELSYNVYRDSILIGSTAGLTILDRITTQEACYEVTAVYNNEQESSSSNTSCVILTEQPKLPLTVTVDDAIREYGAANPVFVLHYDGFTDDDTEADLETLPIASTIADTTSETGSYEIVLSGGEDPRYDFIYANGTLTVTAKPQTIDFPEIPTQSIRDEAYVLNAKASSGLPVKYTIESVLIADFASDGKTLLFRRAGETEVTAYVEPNSNFTAAESVIRTLKITDGSDVGTVSHLTGIKVYPNPIGVGQQINIAADLSADILEGAVIEIYNASGTMVQKETTVTNNNRITMPHVAGNYIIRLVSGDDEKTVKVVVIGE
jgi:PKD repeat protein